MWRQKLSIFPNALLLLLGYAYSSVKAVNTNCGAECASWPILLVCGSDGNVYKSPCHLQRATCQTGTGIKREEGLRCDTKLLEPCYVELQRLLSAQSGSKTPAYEPRCTPEGSFEQIQCHQSQSRWCWCVHPNGKAIPKTVVSDSTPNCRRRSVRRPEDLCGLADQTHFTRNLVDVFSEEYKRVQVMSGAGDPLSGTVSQRVKLQRISVVWKFNNLDANSDGQLDKNEIRDLRRMARKVIEPSECAKKVFKKCDADKDRLIGKSEWQDCLAKAIDSQNTLTKLIPDRDSGDVMLPFPFAEAGPNLGAGGRASVPGHNPGSMLLSRPDSALSSRKGEGEIRTTSRKKSCHDERAEQLERRKEAPNDHVFVFECLPDGRYRSEQCLHATDRSGLKKKYCFCVDEATGLSLDGKTTTVDGSLPDCNGPSGKGGGDGSNTNGGSSFKGCSFAKHRRFIEMLLDNVTSEMVVYSSSPGVDVSKFPRPDPKFTVEDRAVRWKFNMMDTNGNGQLDRRELKLLKGTLTQKKDLRKCGRNFLRYCDRDNDRKISVTEWVKCTKAPKKKSRSPIDQMLQDL